MSDKFRSIEDRIKDLELIIKDWRHGVNRLHAQHLSNAMTLELNEAKLRCLEDDLAKLKAEKAQIDAANEANP